MQDCEVPFSQCHAHCQFFDVTVSIHGVTVFLENPVGCRVVEERRKEEFTRKLLQK